MIWRHDLPVLVDLLPAVTPRSVAVMMATVKRDEEESQLVSKFHFYDAELEA